MPKLQWASRLTVMSVSKESSDRESPRAFSQPMSEGEATLERPESAQPGEQPLTGSLHTAEERERRLASRLAEREQELRAIAAQLAEKESQLRKTTSSLG